MIFRPTVWQRRTLWVWNAANDEKTTAQWIAANASRLGFRCVVVKVHDGDAVFQGAAGENAQARYYSTLKAAGLIVGGWGWLTGDGLDGQDVHGVEREAQRAAERVKTLGLAFYIADPEDCYAYSGAAGGNSPTLGAGYHRFAYSRRFVQAFAAAIGSRTFPRSVASYGRCDLHDLDWHAWATPGADGYRWRCSPQAYRNESQALDPSLCVKAALPFWPRSLIHPVLGVYQGALGRLSPAQYAIELQAAGTVGFGVYSLDSVLASDLPAYGRIQAAR